MSNGTIGPINEPQTFDLTVPRYAAWVCGRQLHRLEHFMQVAWLSCDAFAREQVRRTWPALRLASRGLFDSEVARLRLQGVLEESEGFWKSQFGTEWHAELICECDVQLGVDRRTGRSSESGMIEETCTKLLFYVTDLMASLRRSFSEAIGNELFECLCLAEFVDQVIHPLPAYRYMSAASEMAAEIGGWNTRPNGPPTQGVELPQLPVRIESVALDHWQGIEMRWRQLSLPPSSLPSYAESCSLAAEALINLIEDRFRAANLVHQGSPLGITPGHEVGQAPSSPASPTASTEELSQQLPSRHHLGLRLDGRLLFRESYPQPVEFERRLQINLVQAFLDRGRNSLTYVHLSESWREFGGTEQDPEDQTIRAEISRLRVPLRELRIEIANIRDSGWYLTPIPE